MKFDIRDHTPVVSVCLITYNHGPYIQECLDSLLSQDTNFPYEICIGEDESTDGTREICIEYAQKYPDRIRLLLRSQSDPGREAYLSQGVYNYIETTKVCRGKYLALCDGDDAWIDPLKLQKQLDVMQSDPSIALVHSGCLLKDEISGKQVICANLKPASSDPVQFRSDVILRRYPISASTTFMRTADVLEIFDQDRNAFESLPMGDTTTWCELISYGSFHYINEPLGLYRLLPESDSNSRSAEKRFRFINAASNLGLVIGEKYHLPMEDFRAEKVKSCNRYALLSGKRAEIERLHADCAYRFSLRERIIYHASRSKGSAKIMRWIFELRYSINNARLRTSCRV